MRRCGSLGCQLNYIMRYLKCLSDIDRNVGGSIVLQKEVDLLNVPF